MSAAGFVDAARTVGVPFAALVLMWYDHRDEKQARREERKDRREEREQFAEAIEEQTAAFRSLRTEIRVALADGGRDRLAEDSEE